MAGHSLRGPAFPHGADVKSPERAVRVFSVSLKMGDADLEALDRIVEELAREGGARDRPTRSEAIRTAVRMADPEQRKQ